MKPIRIILSIFILAATVSACSSFNQPTNNSDSSSSESSSSINSSEAVDQIYQNDGPKYVPYSEAAVSASLDEGRRTVLFFHAPWCPTCKVLNDELNTSLNDLPDDVTIIKTDYDTKTDLKNKYGVTYQHTLVLIDEDLNQLKKWSGGGISVINSQLEG